ncbi:hypothetical protein A7K95_07125 [Pediococcus parvulus]|nr:AraC family transcriptional regulator [Pediococcus parvulus]OAD63932.1 hypothetical protein A7K95_07125 [Pediococcus parvulus]
MTKFFYEQITPNHALPFRLLIHDTGAAHTVLRHWHKSYEIDFVLHGSNRNFILNEKRFNQNAGEVVVINPYEVHGLNLPFEHNRIAITIMLPDSFVSGAGVTLNTQHIQNIIKKDPTCQQLFRQLYNNTKKVSTIGTQSEQIGLTYQLFAYLLDTYSQVQSLTDHHRITSQMDHLTPALTWIEKNFSEKITIAKLAKLANVSPSYFAHLFKTYLQQTPVAYITERRLLAAKDKLKNTTDSIETIAYSSGFPSSKALNKAYSTYYGLTAGQFRKSNQLKEINLP